MAIFGRRSARQRLRSAARDSLAIPAFSAPVDCSAWVLNGLWPVELATVTAETAPLAEYLSADLRRIAESANGKLWAISRSGLAGPARQAAEARVINVARAFAVLRVESTVRQLHKEALEFRTEYAGLTAGPAAAGTTEQIPPAPAAPQHRHERLDPARHRRAEPAGSRPDPAAPMPEPQPEPPPVVPPPAVESVEPVESVVVEGVTEVVAPPAPAPARPAVTESAEQRLHRLLAFVARQQPGLRWAIGSTGDGRTLLVTDLAHGWIPAGVELPDEVSLLEPGRRSGEASALLGAVDAGASYTPGDRLGWASDFAATDSSVRPRELPALDDLGWQLAEATHWREDLPRMTNTLAKAGAAGTGVVDAEIDLLRVHLDTMQYQLLAQYPAVDTALLRNCMLLAATEGIATGDRIAANYHYSWYRVLSAPEVGRWDPR